VNPAIWIPLVTGILTTGLGSLFQLWLFRKLNKENDVKEAIWRIGRIEDAFIAHTGITLNGKPFKSKEH
jgi:hypothetical protein